MVQWIIEHAIVAIMKAVVKPVVMAPFKLGRQSRKGVEFAKAGYKDSLFTICWPLVVFGLVTIYLFAVLGFRAGGVLSAFIWVLAIMGFWDCDITVGLADQQRMHRKIKPWMKDFKKWYKKDVWNNQVPEEQYYVSLAIAFASYAIGKFQQESKPEKVTELQTFFSEDGEGHIEIKLFDYLCFLTDNLENEFRRRWSEICRNRAKQELKLGS
jgi:hypothetical protein